MLVPRRAKRVQCNRCPTKKPHGLDDDRPRPRPPDERRQFERGPSESSRSGDVFPSQFGGRSGGRSSSSEPSSHSGLPIVGRPPPPNVDPSAGDWQVHDHAPHSLATILAPRYLSRFICDAGHHPVCTLLWNRCGLAVHRLPELELGTAERVQQMRREAPDARTAATKYARPQRPLSYSSLASPVKCLPPRRCDRQGRSETQPLCRARHQVLFDGRARHEAHG